MYDSCKLILLLHKKCTTYQVIISYRSVKVKSKMLQNAQHNLIDGDLVWKYLNLDHSEQAAIAKRLGTTPDQIMEDLLEIDRITTHF